MTDIDATQRQVLTSFGVYQMNSNPGGIGNECTHWIYAALFEARALDHDRALHIAQDRPPYTWGRLVDTSTVQRGDIAQFHDFRNEFFVFVQDSAGSQWAEKTMVRGPNHTGMVFAVPRSGMYYQLEAHLHQQGTALMSVRGNTIFYESFSVALSTDDFARIKGTDPWPATVDIQRIDDLLERVDWAALRRRFSVEMRTADGWIDGIRRRRMPVIEGKDVGLLCRVRASGRLSFYCPQKSDARAAMSNDELAREKADLVARMMRGGRRGHSADEDAYAGDNKQQRIRDHRFDWTYPRMAEVP